MRVNRILLDVFIKNYPEQERRTGRTVAIALKGIADALGNPGTTVYISDHDTSNSACDNLFNQVMLCLHQLGLGCFKVHKSPGERQISITYDLFVEVDL